MLAKTLAGDFTTALLPSLWQRGRSSLPESFSQDVHPIQHIPLASDQTSLQQSGWKGRRQSKRSHTSGRRLLIGGHIESAWDLPIGRGGAWVGAPS